ncbi:MAG: cupin domain-containing protein [Candidatus Woesearchaeota archaeon]
MRVRVLTWNKPRQPTEEELRAMFAKEGMKPYISVMEKNEFTDVHEHSHDETRILVKGRVEFSAEGRSYVLKPGDRIDLKAKTPHTAKNLERGQSVMLCATKGKTVAIEIY